MESGLWKRWSSENDRNMNDRWSQSLSMRPLEDDTTNHPILNISPHLKENDPNIWNRKPDPNPRRTRQEEVNELIRFVAELKKKRKHPAPTGYVYASSGGPAFDYNNQDRRRFVYVEEALKGAEMNPTWRQNIFSQRPEDDDEEFRQQIHNNWKSKHYHQDIAHKYWDHERYCILERRQYDRDILATGGFEVGYYPYLMRDCCSLIIRYYCPPDANLSADSVTHLYGLATHAIHIYNLKHQSSFSVANVIKAMTAVAAGTWYYLTFQASNGDHLCTFEAKLFDGFSCPPSNIEVSFVRLKMEAAGASRWIQEPNAAASLIQEEPQA